MKKSIIDALHDVDAVKNNEYCQPHLIIGIDSCDHGKPYAGILLTQGSPTILLGMIDALMHDLKRTRKNIMDDVTLYKIEDKTGKTLKGKKISAPDKIKDELDNVRGHVENLISKLPDNVAEKIKDFQARMEEAIKKGDTTELEKMRDAIQEANDTEDIKSALNKYPFIKKEEDDEDFDIENFKGDK